MVFEGCVADYASRMSFPIRTLEMFMEMVGTLEAYSTNITIECLVMKQNVL